MPGLGFRCHLAGPGARAPSTSLVFPLPTALLGISVAHWEQEGRVPPSLLQLRICTVGNSKLLPLCACPQMAVNAMAVDFGVMDELQH